jgi:hypothetical protein
MTPTPYGFRLLGSTDNTRQLVDYRKAFDAYCHADPAARPEIPAYLSAFTYPVEFKHHLESTGSTRDYRGPVGVPSIKWDLDRNNLDDALHDCRKLAAYLADRYRLDEELLIGFSGGKGFHIEMPFDHPYLVQSSPYADQVCRAFAEWIAQQVGVTIDTGVYDKVRPWRAWNSRHPRTARYKVRIALDDLLVSSAQSIVSRAVEPVPFHSDWLGIHFAAVGDPCWVEDWLSQERAVRCQVEERQASRRAGSSDAGLNALTRQLIVEPTAVEVGERHRRLFSAAANLAEFQTIDDLILAILTDPGLDTGLPPREVERQIRTGIEHARRQRGEGGAG